MFTDVELMLADDVKWCFQVARLKVKQEPLHLHAVSCKVTPLAVELQMYFSLKWKKRFEPFLIYQETAQKELALVLYERELSS